MNTTLNPPNTLGQYNLNQIASLRHAQFAIGQDSNNERLFFIKYAINDTQRQRISEEYQALQSIQSIDSNYLMKSPELQTFEGYNALVWDYKPGKSLAMILNELQNSRTFLDTDLALSMFTFLLEQSEKLINASNNNTVSGTCFSFHSANFHNLWISEDGDLHSIGLADIVTPELSSPSDYWSSSTAPEFILGDYDIDERTEVYAAGVFLFQLLTARPFISSNTLDTNLVYRLFRSVHPVPSDVRPELTQFDSIIQTATQWMPDRRYQHLSELRSAVIEKIGGIKSLTPASLQALV